jgi:hypothetical protein
MMPLIELPQDLYQKLLEKAKQVGAPLHDILTEAVENVEKITPKEIIQRLMMTQAQGGNKMEYDPITLALLNKMLQEPRKDDLLPVFLQTQQQTMQLFLQLFMQMQQQNQQILATLLTASAQKENNSIFTALAQLVGQNQQLSQQQFQTFLQLLQNQYQQTLQLQKEAMEKSEKKMKDELRDVLEEFSKTIEYLATAVSRPIESKSDIDKFLDQLEKFNKLKQKIDQIFYSTPELMEKYKTPEGKPDYAALIIDMLGKNISNALEVLKYKYLTDAQRVQKVQPAVQPVQVQPVPQPVQVTPPVQTTQPVQQQAPTLVKQETPIPKEEPLGRWIAEEQSLVQQIDKKEPPI